MPSTWFSPLLLIFIQYVSSLIVPETIFEILPPIWSKIPPIKKGVDSRIGVGFRFGEHADFQIIIELGPQYDTTPLKHPLSKEDSKRKREAIMYSALKGDLGPWAQTVAKHQMERKFKNVLKRQNPERLPKTNTTASKIPDNEEKGSDWRSTWSRDHRIDSHNISAVEYESTRNGSSHANQIKLFKSQSSANQSDVTQSDIEVLKTIGNKTVSKILRRSGDVTK